MKQLSSLCFCLEEKPKQILSFIRSKPMKYEPSIKSSLLRAQSLVSTPDIIQKCQIQAEP